MVKEKVVSSGYIKLLALYIGHLETEIIMERNTNSQNDIDSFKEKYNGDKNIIIFVIHMDYDDDIKFSDYQKIRKEIHCFDYLRDLVIEKNGKIIHRNDLENEKFRNLEG